MSNPVSFARAAIGWLRPLAPRDLKRANVEFVEALKAKLPHEQAMRSAIGSGFEEIGRVEVGLLRHYGLPADGYLIDVGCGSGRLAIPLSKAHPGRYLGIDLVPDLVSHARKSASRPDWRFEVIDHIGIPETDGAADMVCFFSVLTHLLHEQSYWYLEEARRVLRPGGRIVLSFLEFADPAHLTIFDGTLRDAKMRVRAPLNVFIERSVFPVWAERLDLRIVEIRNGSDAVVPEGALGQALCVLERA